MRLLACLTIVGTLLFAGCLAPTALFNPSGEGAAGAAGAITPVRERANLAFRTDDKWSHTLLNGTYAILPAVSTFVDVQVPLGQGLPVQQAHMGVFLPDIPGCDWTAGTLADPCRVPVVADVGPYYAEIGETLATEPANRLGRFLIENLVPHGYAVAQVSVLGTGWSGGCMDLMGEVEQAGVQAAVTWLGTQPWSNGNVGLIGRSYDGSTPWEAAMVPSPHLKTVVPISGLHGVRELMWKNGSAETRGPAILWGLYYAFAHSGSSDPEMQARQSLENSVCPDTQAGAAHGHQAYATGDDGAAGYWEERSFKSRVLENYQGSVYFIHGMQDWNVDPHMAFPFYQELEAKGLEMKGLFGQWAHDYPDRLAEHEECDGFPSGWCHPPESVRYDWAQDLLEWFNHYLKGTGAKPERHVEIQDNQGRWRIEPTWPPRDASWTTLALGKDLTPDGPGPYAIAPSANMFLPVDPGAVTFAMAPLERDLRIAGLPQFHVTVTPTGPGGQLFAALWDATDDRHLGHAVMDLRYAEGGAIAKPVVPGQPIVARMEFEPLDVLVPAGHVIELRLANTGMDYLPSAVSDPVLIDASEKSVLRLPVIERAESAFFMPPLHDGKAKGGNEDPR